MKSVKSEICKKSVKYQVNREKGGDDNKTHHKI